MKHKHRFSSLFRKSDRTNIGRASEKRLRPTLERLEAKTPLAVAVANTGLASGAENNSWVQVSDDFAVVTVSEAEQGGIDLNGDGDALDRVPHVYDSSTHTSTNLALPLGPGLPIAAKGFVAFNVSESSHGNTDLNGDGDSLDVVVHVYDAVNGTTHNLGLATPFGVLQFDGDFLAFLVDEAAQANTDLNGDGDTADWVMHVYDTNLASTTNLGLANTEHGFRLADKLLAFSVCESCQGGDLNGDGFLSSRLMHAYDGTTGVTTNLQLPSGVSARVGGRLVAFEVQESATGTDVNGDGDATDLVIHVFDASSGLTSNVGFATSHTTVEIAGDKVAFLATEAGQANTDLNGDGDSTDWVLHVFDNTTGTTSNFAIATLGNRAAFGGDVLAIGIREQDQGNADLNGDGDAADTVMHLVDTSTNSTLNTALSGFIPSVEGDVVTFLTSESEQGNTDLNEDGNINGSVLHIYDAGSQILTNVGLATDRPVLSGGRIVFNVPESGQGQQDLNGDNDAQDFVAHVYDIGSGVVNNLRLAGISFLYSSNIDGERLAFLVSESNQEKNGVDLNEDGDKSDFVMHVADLAFSSTDPGGLIEQLIASVQSLNLHNGIDNSLDAKLDSALNALDDINQNNNGAAVNSLEAFINAVQAQSGKKIDTDDANALIDEAQFIIDLLLASDLEETV